MKLSESQYKCPSCNLPLTLQVSGIEPTQYFSVFCPHGVCRDQTCNDGEDGGTEQEAFEKLKQRYEREQENEQ